MKFKWFAFFTCLFASRFSDAASSAVLQKRLALFDYDRNRGVPVELYVQQGPTKKMDLSKMKSPVIIINHGYTVKNTEYSFIANNLASLGYLVVSIQHDLATDPKIPETGNLFERRKPMWERGVQNILFVVDELKKIEPQLNVEKVILIGHSNGGDISMLFTTQYPHRVSKVISLDSLRMPFPTSGITPILSLRSQDSKADNGILPTRSEQNKLGIKVIQLDKVKHIDMCDRGPKKSQEKIYAIISDFLND